MEQFLEGPVVFVDIETNGLNHVRGKVIEVGVIRVEAGQVVAEFRRLIDPEAPLPYYITQLTGITDADVADAPSFAQIADELHEVLDGAIFVAHNVRFDYSFLKQEFARIGRHFTPRQLCTVRLSRALYPQHRSHKLAAIIERHGITVAARHRAYDDAAVLWEFLQIIARDFTPDVIRTAIGKQLKTPSMPKGLDPAVVAGLPDGHGVYIFEDADGRPLYVGKSIHVRTRVRSHFASDHEHVSEFKIAQHIRHVRVHETAGELASLLLESRLVKELQPLYNKQLRRLQKVLLLRQVTSSEGYVQLVLEEADAIGPDDLGSLLAVYTRRSQARTSIERTAKDFSLCPKLCGLEKAAKACFAYQLHKCQGACVGQEPPQSYNERLMTAFANKRVEDWPYASPVLVTERDPQAQRTAGIVVDRWCIIGHLTQEQYCDPVVTALPHMFDLDTYKILRAQLSARAKTLTIAPLNAAQLSQLVIS